MEYTRNRRMLRDSLALLLAVRCRSEEACKQLLARFYSTMDEQECKTLVLRTVYLLGPKERDWLRGLA